MSHEYTAVLKQDGGWWIGWIEEIPGVNYQEKTGKNSSRRCRSRSMRRSRSTASLG